MSVPLTQASVDRPETVLDAARGTVTVPRRLVPVLLAIHAGSAAEPADTAPLELSGITSGGRLHPAATAMLDVVTEPGLVITVDVAGGRTPELATFWCSRRRAVQSEIIDGQRVRLHRVEPDWLPFHLTRVVGAGPRPTPPFPGAVTVAADLLVDAELLVGERPTTAMKQLVASGVEPRWADRLLIALEHRRRVWRVQAVWVSRASGRRVAELTVLDAGPAGYWEITGSPSRLTLTVTSYDDIILALRHFLPDPEV